MSLGLDDEGQTECDGDQEDGHTDQHGRAGPYLQSACHRGEVVFSLTHLGEGWLADDSVPVHGDGHDGERGHVHGHAGETLHQPAT